MSDIPELPVARRRKTAAMICVYLEAEITEKRIDLLSKVLLAGEMEILIREASLRNALPKHDWGGFVDACKKALEEVHRVAESFFILEPDNEIPPTKKTS